MNTRQKVLGLIDIERNHQDEDTPILPLSVLESSLKCQRCRYDVMSNEEIRDHGGDPCEACQGLSNWKAKEAQT